MAILFKEIKGYLARNVRLSICFEDLHYHNYLMVSDIPDHKYDSLFVYGIGMIDVEFSMDTYTKPEKADGAIMATKDDTLKPAIEIALCKKPREIERNAEDFLLFKDLKPYLQIGRNFTVRNRKDWAGEAFAYSDEIPEKYGNMYVYGIGMEDNFAEDKWVGDRKHDTCLKKRMVLVLSDNPRADITEERRLYGKGPFFLVVTADGWNHDADEWLGIYTDKKDAGEAYDRAVAWLDGEKAMSRGYCPVQRVAMFEYIAADNRFREVARTELC